MRFPGTTRLYASASAEIFVRFEVGVTKCRLNRMVEPKIGILTAIVVVDDDTGRRLLDSRHGPLDVDALESTDHPFTKRPSPSRK